MLGNPASLSVAEVLTISVTGLAVVFLCLALLIVAIKLLGIVMNAMGVNDKKAAAPAKKAAAPAAAPKAAAPAAPSLDEETYAALLCAVSEEVGLPLDQFQIVSIKEVA